MHLLLKDCSLLLPYTYKTLSFCFIGSLSPSTFSPLLLLGDHFIFFLNSSHKTFEIEIHFSICTFFFFEKLLLGSPAFTRAPSNAKYPENTPQSHCTEDRRHGFFSPILNIFIKISSFFLEFHLVVF